MDPPAVVGWAVYLAGRGIAIQVDDIGRQAIARADARQLLDEQREMREIARKHELIERQAVEADRQRRAQLWQGDAGGRDS